MIALKELDTKATIETVENIIKNINSDSINSTTHIILNQVHQILCDIIDDLSIEDFEDSSETNIFYIAFFGNFI